MNDFYRRVLLPLTVALVAVGDIPGDRRAGMQGTLIVT